MVFNGRLILCFPIVRANRCEEAGLLRKISVKAEHAIWERKRSFSPGWVYGLPSFVYPSRISSIYIISDLSKHVNSLTCVA